LQLLHVNNYEGGGAPCSGKIKRAVNTFDFIKIIRSDNVDNGRIKDCSFIGQQASKQGVFLSQEYFTVTIRHFRD
jgi:hypothetical protein